MIPMFSIKDSNVYYNENYKNMTHFLLAVYSYIKLQESRALD